MRTTFLISVLLAASTVQPVHAAPDRLTDEALARVTARGLRASAFRVDGGAAAAADGAYSRSAAVVRLHADRRGMWASSTSRAAARTP